MGEETRQLLDLIELVADGHGDIDWDALIRDAPDDAARAALRELRTIAGVAHVHATQVADPASPSTKTPGEYQTAAAVASGQPAGVVRGARGGPSDDEPTDEAPEIALRTWGNFRLIRKVGEGNYGEVYEAIDTFLDHRVALKLLKPNVDKSRILHEAKLLVGLRHPNVIAVHGADTREGRTGFWMDFIEGKTLAEIVRTEKVRSADEAVVIGGTLCRALSAVHSVGIIHRDIKAQNVMRESGGRIVLMDFGAGEYVDRSRGKVRPAGTPLYLAPELFDGGRASVASDIYALGVLLFFLVTGTFPYVAASTDDLPEAHRKGKRRRLQDVRPDLPDAFVEVVDRMLAPDPTQRYESASATRAALETVINVGPVPWPPVPVWKRVLPWAYGAVLSIAAVTLLGLVSTAAFNLAFGRSGGFGAESPFDWFVWGLRSLVSPIIRIGGGVIVLTAVVALAKMVYRLSASLRARVGRLTAACASFARSHDVDDPNLLMQLVVVAGVLMFSMLVFVFWSEVSAFAIFIKTAPAESLAALRPDNGSRYSDYNRVLERLLLMYGFVVYCVYRIARRAARRVELPVAIVAFAVPILSLVTLREVPYRIVFQNEAERVDLGEARCYRIGSTDQQMLLHCPDIDPPRNVVVDKQDPRLRPRGVIESVFTPRADSHPLNEPR